MISSTELGSIAGRTMHGQDGEKIGKIVDVYESTDAADGTFVTVSTGLFGGHASFVPLAQASLRGHDVVVPYSKELVKDAPRVAADEDLDSAEEARLYQHYQLGAGATTARAAAPVAPAAAATTTPRPATDRADRQDGAVTRSEERLTVGTQQVEAGRARLRKRIVTETVTQTVPVHHEKTVLTTEPITDANRDRALDGPLMHEAVHEVVLHDEQPVVSKETVPVERVRLDTRTVTEDVQVSEQVRKEQIEVDEPGTATPRTRR